MRKRPALAVALAALMPFVVGALWYAPFGFGRWWERAHGYDDPARKALLMASAPRNYLASLVGYVVLALVLRFFLYRLAASDTSSALRLAVLVWLGFVATIGLTTILFALQPLSLWAIDAGFQLVYMCLMALILRPPAAATE
ncbi:MAG: DUF1761 domain-containing protein [Gemmatimonadaceae bacterium]